MLEIACFSCCLKILSEKEFLLQQDYANYKEFLCNYHCLEILVMCFLSSKKIIPVKLFFVELNYADYKEFLCNYYCLEILVMCFLRCLKHIIEKVTLMRKIYTKRINKFNEAEIGGVV